MGLWIHNVLLRRPFKCRIPLGSTPEPLTFLLFLDELIHSRKFQPRAAPKLFPVQARPLSKVPERQANCLLGMPTKVLTGISNSACLKWNSLPPQILTEG